MERFVVVVVQSLERFRFQNFLAAVDFCGPPIR